jgi:hypothetical protein
MLGRVEGDLLNFLKDPEPSTLYVGVADEDVSATVVGEMKP